MHLPDAVQHALLAVAQRKTLARGEALFLEGSAPDALFGIIHGAVRASLVGASGREAVITMLEPGHWFGEVSLLLGDQRIYDTYAVEPAEIAVVAAQDFRHLIASRSDIHMAFTRLVCLRLRQALAWIDDAILMPLPVRLARRLLMLSAQPGRGTRGNMTLTVSQEDLAFMLGVSRQSVNHQLKRWEADGTLRVRYRRIELLDTARLQHHASDTAVPSPQTGAQEPTA